MFKNFRRSTSFPKEAHRHLPHGYTGMICRPGLQEAERQSNHVGRYAHQISPSQHQTVDDIQSDLIHRKGDKNAK